jgi:adenylate cyclase class 2
VNHEIECKIPIPDRESFVQRLIDCEAQDHGDVLERNWVFDAEDGRLEADASLLRLRQAGKESITFKGPVLGGQFRRREELEVGIDDIDTMRLLLDRLGFRQIWFYEKMRHTWTYRDCEIVLDEMPEIGAYVEVEGTSDEAIANVLEDLGLDRSQHVPGSYRCLFSEHLQLRGEEMREMRFS